MKYLSFDSLPTIPWKNGLGITRTVAIFPEDADINHFIWRVSIATINDVGKFSNFPNITRSLALLTGDQITLSISGEMIPLTKNQMPITFQGDLNTELIALTEKALDFGVMTHNDHAKHSLTQISFMNGDLYQRQSNTTLCLPLQTCQVNEVQLNPYDVIILDKSDESLLKISTDHSKIEMLITEIDTYPL